jgi:hypothetical protein
MLKYSLGMLAMVALVAKANAVNGATLGFEGVAPAGGSVVATNYSESGFKLTYSGGALVLDSGNPATMVGNNSDWFGFDPHSPNPVTLTTVSGQPFSLTSLNVGPSTHPTPVVPVDFSFEGTLATGGTVNASLTGLTTSTVASLNWDSLSSVAIRATSLSILVALDNVNVAAVPEVTSASLAILGSILLAGTGRSKGSRVATFAASI